MDLTMKPHVEWFHHRSCSSGSHMVFAVSHRETTLTPAGSLLNTAEIGRSGKVPTRTTVNTWSRATRHDTGHMNYLFTGAANSLLPLLLDFHTSLHYRCHH